MFNFKVIPERVLKAGDVFVTALTPAVCGGISRVANFKLRNAGFGVVDAAHALNSMIFISGTAAIPIIKPSFVLNEYHCFIYDPE